MMIEIVRMVGTGIYAEYAENEDGEIRYFLKYANANNNFKGKGEKTCQKLILDQT
jgi:hypothetical protein